MRLKQANKAELLKAALGEIPCDLAITNSQVFNVFTGEILAATIYIYQDSIAHIDYQGNPVDQKTKAIFDAQNKICLPGLIDAHMHVESTMLTPANFAQLAVKWGTTTSITDPHEVANVVGVEGVRYMHDAALHLPMRQLIDIPSCVPSVHGLENAGARFLAPEIEELAGLENVVGLAEVMDYLGVAHGEKHMMDIIEVAQKHGLYIQGHAPLASDRILSAYIIGGPTTCHESRSGQEAQDKLRQGLYVDARESSMSRNVEDILAVVAKYRYHDTLCLCTDDREAKHILERGHMNDVVNVAIAAGMDPRDAIRSASFNSARAAHIENIGAIAPGYLADLLLVDDIRHIDPSHVFFEGKLVVKDHKLLEPIQKQDFELEKRNTVFIDELSLDDLILKAPEDTGKVSMNIIHYPSPLASITQLISEELDVNDGTVVLKDDMMFVALVNRHPDNSNIALAVVKGFGHQKGCVASTVSHDSHNLTLVYKDPRDALVAVNALRASGGGFVTVLDGKIIGQMDLPVCGLMSPQPAEELALESQKLKEANLSLGMGHLLNPVMRICTLALIVIPNVKMSDLGMIDVNQKKIIPVFN